MKVPEGRLEDCGRIGHSIKGAAANLMCYKLRDAALAMERVGLAAANKSKPPEQLQQELLTSYAALQREMSKLEAYLQSSGLV